MTTMTKSQKPRQQSSEQIVPPKLPMREIGSKSVVLVRVFAGMLLPEQGHVKRRHC
jgi:hypothetical protein